MPQKAVFFDRDDTLIEDPGLIQHPDQVRLLPGVAESLKMLKKIGYLLVIVTQYSGLERGLINEKQLARVHKKLKSLLAAAGVLIEGVYHCPYSPNGIVKDFSVESNLGEPDLGMFFQAEEDLDIDLQQSWMVGDSYRDIEAGRAAGCRTILVDVPGKIRERQNNDPKPDRRAVNLREVVNIIRMHEFHQKAQSAKHTTQELQNKFNDESPKTNDRKQTGVDILEKDVLEEQEILNNGLIQEIESEEDDDQTLTMTDPAQVEEHYELDTESEEEEVTERSQPKPQRIYTAKRMERIDNSGPSDESSESQHLLEEILHRLQSKEREGLYKEFSVFKLLSLMIQVVAVFCLIMSLCFWLSPKVGTEPVLIMIGYAVALQMLVIALLLMHSRE